MRHQNRLSALQMGVGRHGRVSRTLGTVDQQSEKFRQLRPQLVNADPDIQPKISGNLLIAAASAVKFVPRVADKVDQVLLYEVVNILSFRVFKKRWRAGRLLCDPFQSLEN